MTGETLCPFCNISADRILFALDEGLAIRDSFPVTEGHTLAIPRRHVASIYELDEAEQKALWVLVRRIRALLVDRYHPDGFNIGMNDGEAAGQTVSHAHIHVIPRRHGDVADPRGGVRWIIPEKARYWE